MAEERSENQITTMLGGQFFHHFCTAFRVGSIILGNNFNRPAVDPAFSVDLSDSGIGGTAVPASIGRPDSSAVNLKPDADRLRTPGLVIAANKRHNTHPRGEGRGCAKFPDQVTATR